MPDGQPNKTLYLFVRSPPFGLLPIGAALATAPFAQTEPIWQTVRAWALVLILALTGVQPSTGGNEIAMLNRQLGTILLAGAFLVAGLAWIITSWGTWPRTSNTSPLMALFAGVCACVYVGTAMLTWRRSRLAAPALIVAMGLLLFPARYLVPGGQISQLATLIIISVGAAGYWYLRRMRGVTA